MDLDKLIVFYYKDFFSSKNIASAEIWKDSSMSKLKAYWHRISGNKRDMYAFNLDILRNFDYALVVEPSWPQFLVGDFLKINPNLKIKCWMTNIVSDYGAWKIKYLQNHGVEVFSFDPDDCKTYGITFNYQSYPFDALQTEVPILGGCYYCGKDKGRMSMVLNLQKELDRLGICYKIDVLLDKKSRYKPGDLAGINFITEEISYDDMARNIKACDCVVEFVQKGQMGMTRRPLDAILYDKKLITNNRYTKNYDFYDPRRIFILGEDRIEKLSEFLSRPTIKYTKEEKDKISWSNWLKGFCK